MFGSLRAGHRVGGGASHRRRGGPVKQGGQVFLELNGVFCEFKGRKKETEEHS